MAKDKHKKASGQLLDFMQDSYLDRTARPIYALAYLIPFILFYELGTILINPNTLSQSMQQSQIRVVAFVWIRNMIEYLGFSVRASWIATPLVVIIILLTLQLTSKTKWRIKITDFLPMTLECIILAVPLIILSMLFNRQIGSSNQFSFFDSALGITDQFRVLGANLISCAANNAPQASGSDPASVLFVDIVTGIGAGIYEELVFRLILISLLMLFFQDFLNISLKNSVLLSILISAALFSTYHHFFFINGTLGVGEAFSTPKFIFRMIAGVYFAVLFAIRGFGITAGCHAFYDIIAAVLNSSLFIQNY
jgi:membrane protease YdiL (CAAX protease family)